MTLRRDLVILHLLLHFIAIFNPFNGLLTAIISKIKRFGVVISVYLISSKPTFLCLVSMQQGD